MHKRVVLGLSQRRVCVSARLFRAQPSICTPSGWSREQRCKQVASLNSTSTGTDTPCCGAVRLVKCREGPRKDQVKGRGVHSAERPEIARHRRSRLHIVQFFEKTNSVLYQTRKGGRVVSGVIIQVTVPSDFGTHLSRLLFLVEGIHFIAREKRFWKSHYVKA